MKRQQVALLQTLETAVGTRIPAGVALDVVGMFQGSYVVLWEGLQVAGVSPKLVRPFNPKERKPMAKNHGSDFMFSKIAPTKESIDDVARALDRQAVNGRAFANGLQSVVEKAEALVNSGLSREAVVILVQAKMGLAKNGHEYPASTIEKCLDALLNLGDYLELPGGR